MDGPGCALVTGVSRGIGREVAVQLAREGYAVAGCFVSHSAEARASEEVVRATGARVLFGACDVRDAKAVTDFVCAAEAELGPITALVNNAGVTRDNPIALMPPADWQTVLDINLTGTWNVCKAVLFGCMKRGRGAVVNISSVAGVYGNRAQSNYAASKAGIIGMSKSLAKEVARFGVRVNVVAPGFIETDMTAALSDKARAAALEQIPLRRFGSVRDVAETTAFLLSERASFMTGQVVQVDGGMVL